MPTTKTKDKALAKTRDERYAAWLAIPTDADPDAVVDEIVGRTLDAADVASLLGGTTPKEAIEGQTISVRSFKLQASDIEDGGYFAVMEVVNLDGEVLIVTCGGKRLVAQLVRAGELGALPLTCSLRSARTSAGYDVWYLAPAK